MTRANARRQAAKIDFMMICKRRKTNVAASKTMQDLERALEIYEPQGKKADMRGAFVT